MKAVNLYLHPPFEGASGGMHAKTQTGFQEGQLQGDPSNYIHNMIDSQNCIKFNKLKYLVLNKNKKNMSKQYKISISGF